MVRDEKAGDKISHYIEVYIQTIKRDGLRNNSHYSDYMITSLIQRGFTVFKRMTINFDLNGWIIAEGPCYIIVTPVSTCVISPSNQP